MIGIDTIALLTLMMVPGLGRGRVRRLIHLENPFAEAEKLMSTVRRASNGEPKNTAGVFDCARQRAERVLEQCTSLGIRVIGYCDPGFPTALLGIPDPPMVLYVRGSFTAFDSRPHVAVIGTRKPSPWAHRVALECAKFLASRGASVVSGLALGCDTQAHTGALDSGGVTVAVLAHGLHMIYPKSNSFLAERIAASGCLVSEYPPGTRIARRAFVERNRLQSGFSRAAVVVETGIDGGSMHTARYCLRQNRQLACMVPPGGFGASNHNSGNRQLIEVSGAQAVRSIEQLDNLLTEPPCDERKCTMPVGPRQVSLFDAFEDEAQNDPRAKQGQHAEARTCDRRSSSTLI